MFESIIQHRSMLADQVRMSAYQRALHQVVKPGDVVVDIGTGSGILAYFALQAQASRVYAIERDREVIQQAAKLAAANQLDQQIVFLAGNADKIEIPEKGNVLVSETLGYFGIDEDILDHLGDARQRFLQDGGAIIPAWLELYLVPVEADAVWQKNAAIWRVDLYGVDFSAIKDPALSNRWVVDCSSASYLAAPVQVASYDFYHAQRGPEVFEFAPEFAIDRTGKLHGLVGYFKVGLSPDVTLSTAPDAPATHWHQMFFPLEESLEVEAGCTVACQMKIRLKPALFWQWQIAVHRDGQPVTRLTRTDFSLPQPHELWKISQPGFKPVLSQRGQVYRRLLELCNGSTTMEEIAQTMSQEWPDVYSNPNSVRADIAAMLKSLIVRED